MTQKAIFILFKGLSFVRNCVRPESGHLSSKNIKHYNAGVQIQVRRGQGWADYFHFRVVSFFAW